MRHSLFREDGLMLLIFAIVATASSGYSQAAHARRETLQKVLFCLSSFFSYLAVKIIIIL